MAVEGSAAATSDADSFEHFMGKSLADIPDSFVQAEPIPGSEELEVKPPEEPVAEAPVVETPPVVPEPVPEPTAITDRLAELLGEKKIEAPVTEAEEPPPAGSTPAAAQRWAEMRQDVKWRKQHEPKLAELTKEVEELRGKTTADPAKEAEFSSKLKQVEKERDDYLQELQVSRVEATPEYKQYVEQPLNELTEAARALAKKHEVGERDLLSALREGDADKQGELLNELASAFNDRDKARLFHIADRMLELQNNGNYIKANAKTALASLEKSKEARATEEAKVAHAAWEGALNTVGADFKAKIPLLQPIEGQTDWNLGIEAIEQNARATKFDQLEPGQQARLIYQALILPRALTVLQQVVKESQGLKARLGEKRAATPGAGGGDPSPSAQAIPDDVGFLESVER